MKGRKQTQKWKDRMQEVLKGNKFNLGNKASIETRKKMSDAHRGNKNHFYGKHHTEETKKILRKVNIGRKFSEETIKKLSESHRGINTWTKGKKLSEEHKEKIGNFHRGKIRSIETRKKMSEASLGKPHSGGAGEKSFRWIKDRTQLKRYTGSEERRSPAYKDWRRQVCLRDNFKCKIGNADCSGRLEVHHILGFTEHPE